MTPAGFEPEIPASRPHTSQKVMVMNMSALVLVAVPSKASVCSSLIAGIVGSNSAEGMDVHVVGLLYVVWVAACATG
jgi:hypothetical protein